MISRALGRMNEADRNIVATELKRLRAKVAALEEITLHLDVEERVGYVTLTFDGEIVYDELMGCGVTRSIKLWARKLREYRK